MRSAPGTDVPRPRRKIDWELVACGTRGHFLVGLGAAQLRPQDAVLAHEDGSTRWYRCLRCDAWVALPTPATPTSEYPPNRDEIELPPRGKALHDKVILRLIAVDRAVHFLILGALGFAILALAAHEHSLRGKFYRVLTDLQGGVAGGPVQSSGHVGIAHELDKLFSLRSGTLHTLGFALLAYAVLEGAEAVGLWRARRWAEYLTVLATAILLPLEIYEIIHRASALKIIGFLINLAIVVYLLMAKRLFGLRGGGAAEARERARDSGWDVVEHATPSAWGRGVGAEEPG